MNKNIINKKSKLMILIIIFIIVIKLKLYLNEDIYWINNYYLSIQKYLNLSFQNNLDSIIRIGIYYYSIKNGGIERLISLLIKYLNKVKIFEIYLFTIVKESNEYIIPNNINRKIVKSNTLDLIKTIKRNKIDILIYNFYNYYEINILNQIKEFKIIYYNHSCLFYWIYSGFYLFSYLYKAYKQSKYIISLVPFENDFLFKKWGINSILMNNFITYEYNEVIPSNLSSKIILMIGRGEDKQKRFELGIQAMKYIIQKIPDCIMRMISKKEGLNDILNLTVNLKLQDYIEFIGYSRQPEKYYKNASLHIFPSVCESFALVLIETKAFGIPSIILGLDYLSAIKGGVIIIYDDNPNSIAKEAIKILNNEKYRLKLGSEARESIKKFNNILTLNKWIKLILSIYNGENYYQALREKDTKIDKDIALNQIETQIKLVKMRKSNFYDLILKDIENISFTEKFK